MDSIKNKLPTIKIPKLKKFREWNGKNAETLTTNITQFMNRYYTNNKKATSSSATTSSSNEVSTHEIPQELGHQGISTISGDIVVMPARDKSKDNYGSYAMKSDRNAAKKGLVLSIPQLHKGRHKRSESTAAAAKGMIHEKFRSVRDSTESNESAASAGSINDYEEEFIEIEMDEPVSAPAVAVAPVIAIKQNAAPVVPPRRKPQRPPPPPPCPNLPKNDSELYRIQRLKSQVQPKPDANRNIFLKKEESDVFREFDEIFTNQPSIDSIPPIPEAFKQELNEKLKKSLSSSFSSSIEENYEQIKRKAIGTRRVSCSTIKVQDFKVQDIPRCKSIIPSPKKPPSPPSSPPATHSQQKSFPPASILKKTKPPIATKPLSQVPIKTIAANIDEKDNNNNNNNKPTLKVSPKPTKRFFVYYNDEDDLVFNKNYAHVGEGGTVGNVDKMMKNSTVNNDKLLLLKQHQQQQHLTMTNFVHFNHADALFKHYYLDHDSLRSAISTDGIFI